MGNNSIQQPQKTIERKPFPEPKEAFDLLKPMEKAKVGKVGETEKEVIVTQENFTELFFKRVGKTTILTVPETWGAVKTMVKHPILTAGVIWDEVKKHPVKMVANLSIVYPLGESLFEEYEAYNLAGDSNVSNEKKLKALNDSADKFARSMVALLSVYGTAKIAKFVKVTGITGKVTNVVKGSAKKEITNIAKFVNTKFVEPVKTIKFYAKLSKELEANGIMLDSATRMAVIPNNSMYRLSRILFGAKRFKTTALVDVNDAFTLNQIYGEKLMTKAINIVDKTVREQFKLPGLKYGWEENLLSFQSTPLKVKAIADKLPAIISREVYDQCGVELTVKIGISKITSNTTKTILRVDRAAALAKIVKKPIVWADDLERLIKMKGNWKKLAGNWAEKNYIDETKFVQFIENERNRIPLVKLFDKKFIKDTKRIIKRSDESASASIMREMEIPHDPLHVLAPDKTMVRSIANSLSNEGDFTFLKFSPSIKGIQKLSPHYMKYAKRTGTMKFLNDGTLEAYNAGDIGACGALKASLKFSKKYNTAFTTRWTGLGDEITTAFKGKITNETAKQFVSDVQNWLNRNALSQEARKLRVRYKIVAAHTSASKGTPIYQVLEETGNKLKELKEIKLSTTLQ